MTASEVVIAVTCDGRPHQVIVAPAKGRAVRVTTPDHASPDAEAVLMALGAPGPACFEVKRSVEELRLSGMAATEAARWVSVAGDAASTRTWLSHGYDLATAAAWIGTGISDPGQAEAWRGLGVEEPGGAAPWIGVGVCDAAEAAAWSRIGVRRPGAVGAWKDAGASDGHDAEDWVRSGVHTPAEAARWRLHGVAATAARQWRAAGITDPDELAAWLASGVRTPAQLECWYRAGVGHPDRIRWWEQQAGTSGGEEAARWVRPRLVTGPEEIRAWRAAGVDDPGRARRLVQEGREPAAVGHLRAGALSALRFLPDGSDGRVATRICREGGLVTEIYWYAYDHSCVPDLATHWYAVDFLGDQEVRDSRSGGLAHHPTVEAAGGVVAYVLAGCRRPSPAQRGGGWTRRYRSAPAVSVHSEDGHTRPLSIAVYPTPSPGCDGSEQRGAQLEENHPCHTW